MERDIKMTNTKGIIYCERNGFYYQANDTAPVAYNFPPNVVANLEVLDREKLELDIKTFIQNNKLSPATLMFVLGHSVIFEKDFTDGDPNQQEIAIQKFLDNVPFEFTVSKSFPLNKGKKVIAANKDVCKTIKSAFEKEKFIVLHVVPVIAFGQAVEGFNQNTVTTMMQHFDGVKNYNILEENTIVTPSQESKSPQKKHNNTILIALFVVLMIVAGILVYYAFYLQP